MCAQPAPGPHRMLCSGCSSYDALRHIEQDASLRKRSRQGGKLAFLDVDRLPKDLLQGSQDVSASAVAQVSEDHALAGQLWVQAADLLPPPREDNLSPVLVGHERLQQFSRHRQELRRRSARAV